MVTTTTRSKTEARASPCSQCSKQYKEDTSMSIRRMHMMLKPLILGTRIKVDNK